MTFYKDSYFVTDILNENNYYSFFKINFYNNNLTIPQYKCISNSLQILFGTLDNFFFAFKFYAGGRGYISVGL